LVELSDSVIKTRARLADALALIFDTDPRVLRWRRVEFAHDGGAVVVVQLMHTHDRIAAEVIARELELSAASALPKLPWVRVQLA
jgi:2,4-dienoyl-CoA reductase-like NADH-dependent reductase (Old Yellow Enzyme family)